MNAEPEILIVDDNVDLCANLIELLSDQGYSTHAVHTGDAALQALRERPYVVILLDIRLSGTLGTDLLPAMHQVQPDVSVVIMTAYASLETAIQALHFGAYDYFQKPLDMHKLLVTVQHAVEEVRLVKQERLLTQRLQQELVERKQAEELVRRALAEKEVLLKEIHHRVKNNLMVINSLLALGARLAPDTEARSLFRESQNRIHAMARVHQHLYQSADLARVKMGEYIPELVDRVQCSLGAGRVRVRIEVAEVALTVNDAVPCGLIINELISNAMEHAFPTAWERTPDDLEQLSVVFRPAGGRLELIVSDNGVGLPSDAGLGPTRTLGLELVRVLVGQLRGTLDVHSVPGTGATFRVVFSPRTG